MKTTYIITLLIALVSLITSAQIVNIPDPVFKDNLVNHNVVDTNGDGSGDTNADTNNDGEIQVSEAEAVIGLHLAVSTIYSLEGLQSFINLEAFHSTYQQFTSIDVSTMPNLRELSISNNLLGSLDISQNTNLEILYCRFNNLTQLDTSQNVDLEVLSCMYNQITRLDVNQNTNLIEFSCPGNLLTVLDVTHNPNLEQLNLGFNDVTELDLTQNINLIRLDCSGNQISELDISQNINLTFINCGANLLSELEVSNNLLLESLVCADNQISVLDVSLNTNLGGILCQDNQIITLDISQNPNLTGLRCNNNQLVNLNVQNGVNDTFFVMHAQNNPDLVCIQVDDPSYSNSQPCDNFEGWCKDETAIYSEDCNLGILEILATQIVIFPNPVHAILNLENNSSYTIIRVHLYDVLGRLVLQEKNPTGQLDVSNLKSGLFFVQLETDKGVLVKKIVKL